MRRRQLVLVPLLVLLSGCTTPQLELAPDPWWGEDAVHGFAIGSGGGGLSARPWSASEEEREVSGAVSLGSSPPGAYVAQAACTGPAEIEVVIAGSTTSVPCETDRWTSIEFELEQHGPVRAEVRNVLDGAGHWLVGFDPAED